MRSKLALASTLYHTSPKVETLRLWLPVGLKIGSLCLARLH